MKTSSMDKQQPNRQSSALNKKVAVAAAFALLCLFLGLIIRVVLIEDSGGGGGQGGEGKNLGAAWKGDEGDGTGSIVPGTGSGQVQGDAKGNGVGTGEMKEAATPPTLPPGENEKKDNEKKEDAVAEESVPPSPVRPVQTNSSVLYQPDNLETAKPPSEGEGGASAITGTRGSSAAREGALRRFGGSRAGEDSVLKALRWLKRTQADDGSWTEQGAPVAMTGLGLLCFLAHGENPQSKEFGDTVRRAIDYLQNAVQDDGTFDPQKGRGGCTYTHAMGAYGLAEAYGITRDKSIKRVSEAAMAVIIKGQNKAGGWDYRYGESMRNDTSIMGWQVQALKAAKLAGLRVDGLDAALGRASKLFKQHYQETAKGMGTFGYTGPGGGSVNMTGVGTLCLQMLGEPNAREVLGGLATIDEIDVIWNESGVSNRRRGAPPPAPALLGGSSLYGWYYMTQAKFREGGEAWKRWNANFGPEFIASQQADGHWEKQSRWENGPVLSTTLACLSLEVYYRFLPTYTDEPAGTSRPHEGAVHRDSLR